MIAVTVSVPVAMPVDWPAADPPIAAARTLTDLIKRSIEAEDKAARRNLNARDHPGLGIAAGSIGRARRDERRYHGAHTMTH